MDVSYAGCSGGYESLTIMTYEIEEDGSYHSAWNFDGAVNFEEE